MFPNIFLLEYSWLIAAHTVRFGERERERKREKESERERPK